MRSDDPLKFFEQIAHLRTWPKTAWTPEDRAFYTRLERHYGKAGADALSRRSVVVTTNPPHVDNRVQMDL